MILQRSEKRPGIVSAGHLPTHGLVASKTSPSLFRVTPGHLHAPAENIPDSCAHCPGKTGYAGIIGTSASATVHLINPTGTNLGQVN